LTVQVSDGGPGTVRTDTATVTINVTDVNEFDPVLSDATFSVAENSVNGTSAGTVTATDEDATKTLSYSITGGNTLGIFGINGGTGQITVVDKTNLDREAGGRGGLDRPGQRWRTGHGADGHGHGDDQRDGRERIRPGAQRCHVQRGENSVNGTAWAR